jgi:predicted lipoprotein with Yx(FWY)xxD motif
MIISRIRLKTSVGLVFTALMALACAPATTQVQSSSSPAIQPPPTVAATTASAQGAAFTIQLTQHDQLGKILADSQGRTLYLLTKDTKDTSNCEDKCAQSWPPILSSSKVDLKDGLNSAMMGIAQRKDESKQLTYNGWPLYYYGKDQNPGETTGQAVGKVWWVISAEGNPIKPSGLKITNNDKLGKFLADDSGRTVYAFTKDSKDATVCYDKCEQAWPPLLTLGQPKFPEGVDQAMVGSIQRKDGTSQLTFNGMPLYYYAKDETAGETNGEGVGQVWFVVTPDGSLGK